MHDLRRQRSRAVAMGTLLVLSLGLVACGGRATPGSAQAATDATPRASSAVVTDVASSPTDPSGAAPTVTTTLDLPDLSAVEADLRTIDGLLANDASAPTDEGSDK